MFLKISRIKKLFGRILLAFNDHYFWRIFKVFVSHKETSIPGKILNSLHRAILFSIKIRHVGGFSDFGVTSCRRLIASGIFLCVNNRGQQQHIG